jgi:threonine/homoserine/homoserine lactone efflux protein
VSEALIAGLVAGYGIAVPVGAIAPLLISLTARTSLRVGASAAFGVAAADGVYAAVAVVGGTAVARLVRHWGTPARAFFGLLALTLLNPSTVVYFAALVLGRQAAGDDGTAAVGAVFVAAVFAASASWQLLVAGSGSVLGRVLTGPRGRLVTAVSSSVVITVLAVALVV